MDWYVMRMAHTFPFVTVHSTFFIGIPFSYIGSITRYAQIHDVKLYYLYLFESHKSHI